MAIKLSRSLKSTKSIHSPVVLTIGNFDGIHQGHTALLKRVVQVKREKAPDGTAVLFSLYPHPAVVLGKASKIPVLTDLRQKLEILEGIGIDHLHMHRFTTELANVSADDFVNRFLIEMLNVEYLILGPDTAVGKERSGTIEYLVKSFKSLGRYVEVFNTIEHQGEKISSRMIRQMLASGDLEQANQLLGRRYKISARVRSGDGRGRKIGIPTINFHGITQVVPKRGVYATKTTIDGTSYKSATNVGIRPTFGGTTEVIETHLIDYNGNSLYGKIATIEFQKVIREELKFESVDKLILQIKNDIEIARKSVC